MTTPAPPPSDETPRPEPRGIVDPSGYEAPMPTDLTVRLRTNLPLQAWRFAAVGVKMTRMILRSHD